MKTDITSIILESISDGVFTVDKDWKITSFNTSAERITGIGRKEAMGRACCEVFKSNMCENECPLRKTMQTGKPQINKTGYIITLEGKRIPISISTALLKDNKGKVIGGAETFRDLSEIESLKRELKEHVTYGEMSSGSLSMRRIFETLNAISDSTTTILIQGETGTGKEVLARTIHKKSPVADGPFIALNCSALPDNLLESELFGYKRGAFTGADKEKPGRFSLAQNGTIFLDEIGDISPALQVKLLRVLQEKEYQALGSTKTEKTNARVITATNRNLEKMVKEGIFRQDLFYRINIIKMELPPLRERKEDIPVLAEKFLEKFKGVQGKEINNFSPDVLSLFYMYNWPGNIRELENVIERAVVLCNRKQIGLECLPQEMTESQHLATVTRGTDLRNTRKEMERQAILKALERNGNDKGKTAKELKIDRVTLYRKMKEWSV